MSDETTDRLPMPYPRGYYGTQSPRCFKCNSIVYVSNSCCSQCGQVNILPEDFQNERSFMEERMQERLRTAKESKAMLTQPPNDNRGWRWFHVLERKGVMATEQVIAAWSPTSKRWRDYGTPAEVYAKGWRYLRPAKPEDVNDTYA